MVHEWAGLDWATAEFWSRFAVASLVTWRLTHLIAFEDGPFDGIAWLRQKAGPGFFGKLMDCFYCSSMWIAAPMVLVVGWTGLADAAIVWIALSGAACLLERATAPRV